MNVTPRGPQWRDCAVCVGIPGDPRYTWDECAGCTMRAHWTDWGGHVVMEARFPHRISKMVMADASGKAPAMDGWPARSSSSTCRGGGFKCTR